MAAQRGFQEAEYCARVGRAQAGMAAAGLAGLLLTTEPEVRYFTGFLTRFWESPTRPWFLVIPTTGAPIAVIPSIGAALMGKTWITDIRTWASPDPADDGISLLIDALSALGGPIGLPSGHETHVRLPKDDLDRLARAAPLTGDGGLMRQLRLVKSEAEIAKIERACQIAGRAFARVPGIARAGVPLDRVFRDFQRLCLEEGADWVPYLAGAAGAAGYDDVISPATEAPLEPGDILMLDTGLVWDGYFCDYDRNWSVGPVSREVSSAYDRLLDATAAGLAAAKPGATAADVCRSMQDIVGSGDAGRLGHGLGMQLTEWPSLITADHTPLEPGMVLTLEPCVEVGGGRILVHEENIVVTEGAPRMISPEAPGKMPVL